MTDKPVFIRWFKDIGLGDVAAVGGKNASLGELYRELSAAGVRVPNGFAITSDAFRYFVREAGLTETIEGLTAGLSTTDLTDLARRGRNLREAIVNASLPADLQQAIISAYEQLGDGSHADVAVRSSATAEDLPEASFAGQHETYLNVRGPAALIDACKRAFASLFTDRAISYRADKGFAHTSVALSIGVQRMVRSDLGVSGIMFTLDPETGFRDVVVMNASYGLGEPIVQGSVTPDEYWVFKRTLAEFRPILRKTAGTKEFKLVYDEGGSRGVKAVPVPDADRSRYALGEDEILTFARWGCAIEEHYSRKRGATTPMDIEWAKDGRSGELFIVQARPETVHRAVERASLEHYRLKERGRVLVTGRSVGTKIASGRARVILNVTDLGQLRQGEILVTDKTDPDWEPVMKKAAAIVTNRGGRTCHAAIVSRELGVPAVVGTEKATTAISTGTTVTVSCAEGEIGYVYEGALQFEVERVNVSALGKPSTRLMMNVGNPDEAFALSFLPNDGVGLARIEFIISSSIGVHPLALVRYPQLDAEARDAVDRLTAPYADKPAYFVDKLAEGIGTIAAAFYPKNVIVRLSDFKSNEYARLAGGHAFEPVEENPMIGWRGASRYYDERYREGFALECQAVKKVRDQMGLRNVKIMVPFCRTLDEAPLVASEIARHGLSRHDDGLDLYMMVETPANVLQIADFAAHFDGFSIGSNDLTQLTLGVDRDSSLVARAFDERHPAVRSLIQHAIQGAHRAGRTIGLCGQAPSDYADFVRFLVDCGIDSISLNPDSVLSTMPIVLAAEAGRSAASTSHQAAPASA